MKTWARSVGGILAAAVSAMPGVAAAWTHDTVSTLTPDEDVSSVVVAAADGEVWFAYVGRDEVDAIPHGLYLRRWTSAGWSSEKTLSTRAEGSFLTSYMPALAISADSVHVSARAWKGGVNELAELVVDRPTFVVTGLVADKHQSNDNWGSDKGLHVIDVYDNGTEERVRICARVTTVASDDEVYCMERGQSDLAPDAYRDPQLAVSSGAPLDQDHVSQAFHDQWGIVAYSGRVATKNGGTTRQVAVSWERTGDLDVLAPAGADRPHLAVDGDQLFAVWQDASALATQIELASCDADPAVCQGGWITETVSSGVDDATHPTVVGQDGELYVAFEQGGDVKVASKCVGDLVWTVETVDGVGGHEGFDATKSPLTLGGLDIHVVYGKNIGGQWLPRWSQQPRRVCP